MAADKQLIVVLEGTANMGVHWKTIVSDYLEKIVRKFCENEPTMQPDGTIIGETFEMALVQYNTRNFIGAMLMRSGWTRDMDRFLEMLNCMRFSGGGVEDPETAEGLADALMMFAVPENGYYADHCLEGKRHCILVTASNPFPLPVPVYRPNIKDSGPPPMLSDVGTVARWFGQCSVSLSVICSRKLPKVKALYEAARRNPDSEDPPHVQHPRFLVLISESFMEARAALNIHDVAPPQDPVKSIDPNSGAASSSEPVDQLASKEPGMPPGNVAPASLNIEPSVAASLASSHSIACFSTFPDTATTSMLGSSMLLEHSKYVKLWEGNLLGQKLGNAVLISKVEIYRKTLDSPMLADDWPESMQVVRLTPQDHIIHEQNVAGAVLLVVKLLTNHPFFSELQEKKLCAVVELPSGKLLLSVSDKETLLIGTLLSGGA